MKLWIWICVFLVAGIFVYSLTMPESIAVDALTKQGFSEIEVTSRWPFIAALFGCGEDDIVAFKASATNVKGERVDGITVCTGLFKGVTTRF